EGDGVAVGGVGHDVAALGAAGDGVDGAVRRDPAADDLLRGARMGGPQVPAGAVVPDVDGGVGADLQLGGPAVDHTRPVAVDAVAVVLGGLGCGTARRGAGGTGHGDDQQAGRGQQPGHGVLLVHRVPPQVVCAS